MTIDEFLDLSGEEMYGFLTSLNVERLGNVWGILEPDEGMSDYIDHPNYYTALRQVKRRVTYLEQRMDDSYVEQAAVHHSLNFTNRDGYSTGSWGEGSDAVRREVE